MNHRTNGDRTTRLITTWCDIGINLCSIVLKLMFAVALGFAWLLLRIAKR